MDELYENDLLPLITTWVTCSNVKKNLSEVDKEIVFSPLRNNEGIYYFMVKVNMQRYLYDLYGVKEGDLIGVGYGVRCRSMMKNTLPKKESRQYLIEAMRLLNTYREHLNMNSILDLDRRLCQMVNEKFFKEMVPLFFYKNLLQKSQESNSLTIIGPGVDPLNEEPDKKSLVIIRPIYGSSHNPLILSILNEIDMTRTDLTVSFVSTNIQDSNYTIKSSKEESTLEIKLEEDSDLWYGLQYIILSIVKDLDQCPTQDLKNISTVRKLLEKRYSNIVTKGDTVIDIMQFFHNRMEVLRKDILYAVKLTQLYQNRTNPPSDREKNARLAKELVDKITDAYNKVGVSDRVEIENTLVRMIDDFHTIFPLSG